MEQLFHERNSSLSTRKIYLRSVGFYEDLTQHTIGECIDIADDEEYNNIRWKNTRTRKWLMEYREHLYQKYNISTAKLYLTAIMTIYRHYEITIPPLPYYNTKHLKHTPPLNYKDLLDRDIIRECIHVSSPVVKAITLFLSSSGMSRIDAIQLTINDWLDATSEYHDHQDSIKYAVRDMKDQDIIPTFENLTRQKTGLSYFTFCSHEAATAINEYILTRQEVLKKDAPLFKINERYFNMCFERLNDTFQLGKVGNYNRLRPHMLRKYHATQLAESGMSTDHINLLQGRQVPGIAHEYYIKVKPDTLREEYIQALPYLVIDDINRYKTELETVKDENTILKNNLNGMWERLDALEQLTWEDVKKEYQQNKK